MNGKHKNGNILLSLTAEKKKKMDSNRIYICKYEEASPDKKQQKLRKTMSFSRVTPSQASFPTPYHGFSVHFSSFSMQLRNVLGYNRAAWNYTFLTHFTTKVNETFVECGALYLERTVWQSSTSGEFTQ
ncbi:hypothetical protein Y032_0005g2435 [Ancylostoma ceylanicum]|uniref:Uncharacterized protein n=1 Tax=Ancylostoma ceylanicum TaxID=53326 RepID=A0A016VS12_9BILA|nr:hypothetical protein Y032_0005g2435 [Ancylostoma ceylanicum]